MQKFTARHGHYKAKLNDELNTVRHVSQPSALFRNTHSTLCAISHFVALLANLPAVVYPDIFTLPHNTLL